MKDVDGNVAHNAADLLAAEFGAWKKDIEKSADAFSREKCMTEELCLVLYSQQILQRFKTFYTNVI